MGLAGRIRGIFDAEHLTLRQVIYRSRLAFAVFVVGLFGVLLWNTTWKADQDARNDAQARRNMEQIQINRQTGHRLAVVVNELAHEGQLRDYALKLAQREACLRANNVIGRIIFVVAAQGGSPAQVATIRNQLGVEKCPPAPKRPPPPKAPLIPRRAAGSPAPPAAPSSQPEPRTTTTRPRRPPPPPTTAARPGRRPSMPPPRSVPHPRRSLAVLTPARRGT